MDFTLDVYRRLIESLTDNGYVIISYADYCCGRRAGKYVVMRHDIDRNPNNALYVARIENQCGVSASYYFRAKYFDCADIIRKIEGLGHEVGYHYEDLVAEKGDRVSAYTSFAKNLACLRKMADVKTVVMHGSPLSYIDNRDLWKEYDYRKLGIIGEPYFDVDFDKVFYITDTGRSWNGISRRDSAGECHELWKNMGYVFRKTSDIIRAAAEGRFPKEVMMTTHPQRWTDNPLEWVYEIVAQSIKNVIKKIVIRKNLTK